MKVVIGRYEARFRFAKTQGVVSPAWLQRGTWPSEVMRLLSTKNQSGSEVGFTPRSRQTLPKLDLDHCARLELPHWLLSDW